MIRVENPDWDKIQENYLMSDTGWQNFVTALSANTENGLCDSWQENFDRNIDLVRGCGSALQLSGLWGLNNVAIIIGASPALRKNCHQLKAAKKQHGFIKVAVGSALRFLLSRGIKPDYTVVCDGSIKLLDQIKGLDTKDLTLVANAWVHPEVLKEWKGRKLFCYLPIHPDRDKENLEAIEGVPMLTPGGNCFNFGFNIAYWLLKCKSMIFVGNELCFDKEYYADGTTTESRENAVRHSAISIRGEERYTTADLFEYKLWLEDACGKLRGFFINATEDGILGQTLKYGRLPWIQQFPLKFAIESAKQAIQMGKEEEKKMETIEMADSYLQVGGY